MTASTYYPTRDVKRDDERDGLLDCVRFLAEHNKRAEERSAALRAKLDALRLAASAMLDHLYGMNLSGCQANCRDELQAKLEEANHA